MLKITMHIDAGTTGLKLEGRLAGPWVEELEGSWSKVAGSRQRSVKVDLSDVTFIDQKGKALLTLMWQQGAELHAEGCFNMGMMEEITKIDPDGIRSVQPIAEQVMGSL